MRLVSHSPSVSSYYWQNEISEMGVNKDPISHQQGFIILYHSN